MNSSATNSPWLKYLPAFLRAKLVGRHNMQAALGSSAWLVGDRVFRMGVGFLAFVWVARYLGPTQWGQLNYAIALTSLVASLASLGTDRIVIRELVKHPEQRDTLLGSAMMLKLIGAALAMVSVVAAVSILRPGDRLSLWLVVLFAFGFVTQSVNVIELYFRATVEPKYTVIPASVAFLLTTVAKIVLVFTRAPLIGFALTGFAEGLLTVILLCVAYQIHHLNLFRWRVSWAIMLELLKDSWPLILTGISITIAMRIDQVLIGQMLNDKQVGLYSAAVRISEIWYFVPVTLATSTFPALIESRKRGDEFFYKRLQQVYDTHVGIGIAMGLIMTLFSGVIITLLFGKAFAASAGVLKVLIWSGIPVCFGCAWANWMVLENRTRSMFLLQVGGSISNVILNLVLIPRFGILGSAYATLISYWIPHTVVAAMMKSQRKALFMLARSLVPFSAYFEEKIRGKLARNAQAA